jgi:hypothetical protein
MGMSRDDAPWADIVWWSFVLAFEEGYSREHKWENPKNVTARVSWLTWQASLFNNERIK